MNLVFLGTPQFAVPNLVRVLDAGHHVLAVYTQPDRPKGRGRELAFSPVKQIALARSLSVRQPERIRRPEVVAELTALQPDAMVIVGYGQIIPQSIIDIPPLGIINVHASLLPKYRGAAPIQWAIARGESITGVTTMRIDAGLDTGGILLMRETPIAPEETSIEVGQRLAAMGADLLVETLEGIETGSIQPRKQDDALATLAPILRKEDGLIDWEQPAREIVNRVRGFVPWPGAHTLLGGRGLQIWKARTAGPGAGKSGEVSADGRRLLVNCGDRMSVELLEVQMEGRRRMAADAFLNGQHVRSGERLGKVGE
jgi:methionyl-tRNA formyltransferase